MLLLLLIKGSKRKLIGLTTEMTAGFSSLGILSWLVYIIGAEVGGRVSFSSTDEHDAMDGELVCRFVILHTEPWNTKAVSRLVSYEFGP